MSQTVTLADAEGPLGTITLDGGQLTGSTRPLQRVADRELARTGSAGAAFSALQMLSNGYVWALRPGPETGSLAPVLRETETANNLAGQLTDLAAWEHERRGPDGRWTRTGGLGTQLLEREREYQQTRAEREASQHEYPVIGPEHARGNSRAVSHGEFQELARKGNSWVDKAKRDASPITGLDDRWGQVKANAYQEARKSWGGATIDAHTGVPLAPDADLYALSVKPRGMDTVSVPETASEAKFSAAMDRAKELFRSALERKGYHLGVFHDDEHNRIDIDPVAIVDSVDLVEQVGSYTRAVGGAFRFSDGNGYFPPHVAEGADMAADETTVHFRGPGEWHSQAVEIQEPEPDDEPDED